MNDYEKILCPCGNILEDVYDHNPVKGSIIRSQDDDFFTRYLGEKFSELLEMIKLDNREQWIKKYLPNNINGKQISNEQIFSLFIGLRTNNCELRIFECPGCGRLLIETNNGSNSFVPFSPDTTGYKHLLTSQTYLTLS